MIKILFICHGNICRSPMAEFVLKDMVEKEGRSRDFIIESAATTTEEIWNGVGSPVYPPARKKLLEHGIDPGDKRARLAIRSDYPEYDYIIGMDLENKYDMQRIFGGDPEGKLFLAGDTALCKALKERGFAAAAWSHPGNREDRFPGASYVLEEPAWVDDDSLNKIYQRLTGNPWKILETERTLVREFVPEDLEDIYGLYDEEAGRYLEPPGPDTERERQILKDYIGRIYGLFGFGHWAVLSKLIGRMGFSLPTAREKEILGADAMLGYLTAKEARGAGLTLEVTRALLDYGKNFLLFERVGAEADAGNTASVRQLEKLGFERVMEEKGKILFSRKA